MFFCWDLLITSFSKYLKVPGLIKHKNFHPLGDEIYSELTNRNMAGLSPHLKISLKIKYSIPDILHPLQNNQDLIEP